MNHDQPPVLPPSDSLSDGEAGIALAHIARAQAGTESWASAHQFVRAAASDPITAHPDHAGLFRGAPAIAYTLRTAGLPSYATALVTLDRHTDAIARHRLADAHARIDHRQLPTLREYDLISGLTGIGAYLLRRHDDQNSENKSVVDHDVADNGELLSEVLDYLVRLTEPIDVNGESLPGWWCRHGPADQPADQFRGGHGNLGLAHGIAGPLALLATATLQGIAVTGQRDAMNRILAVLDNLRAGEDRHAWWPELITRNQWNTRRATEADQSRRPHRPSWCYGTPGLARAQQLAGLALDDHRRQRLAEAALAGCVTDQRQLDHLVDASICHGWAGLLHTTWRAALDSGPDSELADLLPGLRSRLRQFLDRRGEPADPGLLGGTAGIELVQRTQTAGPCTTGWDACLLLGGSPPASPETTRISPTTMERTS